MSEPEVGEDARRLLGREIDSIEKLELLFLAWSDQARTWTTAAAAERLRLPADAVATAADELASSGMLIRVGETYRLAGAAGPNAASVDALCRLYDADRLLVLKVMTSLAMDRIRSSAARVFADAFRFRKDPGKGGSDA
ncbi:MAG TPA: hypothetical protein VHE35_02175 [Kofleriaceae bacterium]|nr:hypothetical protein [Kofleriaceae bacterium]